jgi:hypothetical protein
MPMSVVGGVLGAWVALNGLVCVVLLLRRGRTGLSLAEPAAWCPGGTMQRVFIFIAIVGLAGFIATVVAILAR